MSFDAPNEQYANNEAERAAMGHDQNANAPLMDDEEVCTLSSSMSTAAFASVSSVASAPNFGMQSLAHMLLGVMHI